MKGILTFALLSVAATTCMAQSLRSSSLVDAHADSLAANHKIVYIDGKPETATEAHADSIRHIIDTKYMTKI